MLKLATLQYIFSRVSNSLDFSHRCVLLGRKKKVWNLYTNRYYFYFILGKFSLQKQNESYNIRRDLMAHNWKQSSPENQALNSGHNHNLDSFAQFFYWLFDGSAKIVCTLISLINVTSRLPILENSTLHKTKIHPARLLISLQNF